MLGLMERAFAMTLDYLKTRQQFGRIIGTFQSLQHRAADLKMQIALTRAAVEAPRPRSMPARPARRAARRCRRRQGIARRNRACWCCASASSCMAASATPTNTMSASSCAAAWC
jgi:alkylation response protein AidB-like acyl-CoA dehydrogenase